MPGEPQALVRLILDAKVVLSVLPWRGASDWLLTAIWMQGKFKVFSSDVTLDELADIISRDRLLWCPEIIRVSTTSIRPLAF